MIDIKTGDLVINSIPLRIGRQLSRAAFLDLPVGQAAKILVKNEPFSSYAIGQFEISGLLLNVTLYFHSNLLESISMACTEENELTSKKIHDKWLAQILGRPPYKYAWGNVWSDYDPKGDVSSMGIRYSWQGKLI